MKLKHRIAPGIWVDDNDCLHFSAEELCDAFNVENTEANRIECMWLIRQVIEKEMPDAKIIERHKKHEEN